MKLGYPCLNWSIGCNANKTFRLKNFSKENLIEKVENNLSCLQKILEYNVENNLLFFRISSDTVPFASHEINTIKWGTYFSKKFSEIGNFIKYHNIRISMHPDQFTLINAKDKGIVSRSVAELSYHAKLLELMGLDNTAKIQIHVGGVYGDKPAAMKRFCTEFEKLPKNIKNRLAIENDDVSYSLSDCMQIHAKTNIPIIFDTFHHEIKNNGEKMNDAFKTAQRTWGKDDGCIMIDYSSQEQDAKKGKHTESIDIKHFEKTMVQLKNNCDIMLEIKDKEKSALIALPILKKVFKL